MKAAANSNFPACQRSGLEGRIGGADVIFGEEGDYSLFGALTLEALGLSLDPLRRELRQLPMLLAMEAVGGSE